MLVAVLLVTVVASENVQFGTYTAYEDARDKNHSSPVCVAKCEPVQLWLMVRHGTRYPHHEEIQRLHRLDDIKRRVLQNHLVDKRGTLCEKDLTGLKNWHLQTATPLQSKLTHQGYEDLYNMGVRFKKRFPQLLNQGFREDAYQFKFTDTPRTASSAIAFAEGMFGPTNDVFFPEPENPDLLLRAYVNCSKWSEAIHEANKRADECNNGELMETVRRKVSHRLGFNETLPVDDIIIMYDGCRFHHAWHMSEVSPWCTAFSEEDLKTLEFRDDIIQYYQNGYGTELNVDLGCPPIKDLLDRFKAITTCEKQPSGVFYFTHSQVLQQVLLPFGIAKEESHLAACNVKQLHNRNWRTSTLCPFSANFGAVLYKCEDCPFKVQFWLNERPILVDGCTDTLCNWTTVMNKYGTLANGCSFCCCMDTS